MRELQLLARIGQGDESALKEVYRSYQPRLVRFLSRFTSNQQVMEEAVNDTMLVIWEGSARFRGESSPTTWIMGICYNKMLKALKKDRPFPAPLDPTEAEDMTDGLSIAEAVRTLPTTQAAVVVLTYEFGYTYREISEVLNCPENTVKTRMFHARKALKRFYEDQV